MVRFNRYIVTNVACALLIALFYFKPSFQNQYPVLLTILVILLFNHFAYARKADKTRNPIAVDTVFLVGFVAISFSLPLMVLVGIEEFEHFLWRLVQREYFDRSLVLSLWAVAAFSLGFIVYTQSSSRRLSKTPRRSRYAFVQIGFILILVGVGTSAFSLFLLTAGSQYLSGSYQGVYGLSEITGLLLYLSQVLLTLSFIAVILRFRRISTESPLVSIVLLIPYFLLLGFLTISGDRGELILCATPALYFLFASIPTRLRLAMFVAVLLFGLFAIGVLRDSRALENRGVTSIVTTAINYDFQEGLRVAAVNLGGSGLLLPAAVEYREEEATVFGRFTFNSMIGIVPFIRRYVVDVGAGFAESAQLLTYHLVGPDSTTGVGTSSAAEFYLDFGPSGVFFGHLLLGVVAAWLKQQKLTNANDERMKLVYIFAIGVFAILSRYSPTALLVKQLLYAAAAVYVIGLIGTRRPKLAAA